MSALSTSGLASRRAPTWHAVSAPFARAESERQSRHATTRLPMGHDHSHQHDHAHETGHHHHHHSGSARRLLIVLLLTAVYMAAELVGGLMSHSLALIADAGHMLSDVGALGLSL